MLEIKLNVEEIDYTEVIDVILPIVLDKLAATSENTLVMSLLTKMKGLSGAALKVAVAVLPGEIKDELAAAAVNHYSKEIGQLMERAAKEKGITMKLGEISVNS